jgi:hypothetical protein
MYSTEIIPVVGREHWKPTDFKDELVIYTDGGCDPETYTGSWAFYSTHPDIGQNSGSFFPCFNSTIPEERALAEALKKVCEVITAERIKSTAKRINLNSEKGGIISGRRTWYFLPRVSQTRHDIMQ